MSHRFGLSSVQSRRNEKAKSILLPLACFMMLAFPVIPVHADTTYIDGIDFAGSFIDKYGPGNVSEFAVTQPRSTNPGALAVDSAGNLYVVIGFTGTIQKFTTNGTESDFATSLNGPGSLAFDSGGNLYVSTSDGTIQKFTADGVGTIFATNLPSTIQSLAFDSKGNLYASSSSTDQILKIDPSGNESVFSVSLSLNQPFGVAFDSNDNLYVSNFGGNTVDKFGTNGIGSVFAGAGAGLDGPTGLAFDSSGNLYVVNRIDKDAPFWPIDEFDPKGNESLFTNGLNPGGIAILIPEPSSLLLTGLAALLLWPLLKRRRNY